MQFSQANIASIMMLISERKLTLEESATLINVVNERCAAITKGVEFSDSTCEYLASHFLSKWLINYDETINDDDLRHFSSQLQRGQPTPYKEVVVCSLAGVLTLVNRFMMTMYASGSISESEMIELSGEYSVSLKHIYSEVVDEYLNVTKDDSTKLIIFHMAERSLSQNLSQYFKTIFEQGLVEQFLSNPLTMLEPLKLQVKKEIDLALNLAKKVI